MLDQTPRRTVTLFRGTYRHIAGALENQKDYLHHKEAASIVTTPVEDDTIRAIYEARRQAKPSVELPIPDAIHAIEALHRMADSLFESAAAKRDLPGEFAEAQANGLRAIANMTLQEVMEVYELSPEAQYELQTPLKHAA